MPLPLRWRWKLDRLRENVAWFFGGKKAEGRPRLCPSCGTLGLITRRQIAGLIPVICGSNSCPAQFLIRESEIVARKPS